MRPRELTLRGFRSYAEDTTFHFGGRNLVGIVGPIGSGKSSILDAVSFALYGKTPRIDRETKTLINQRHDSLHVALTFEVDGTLWKAVRVIRRGGAAAHTLYRVEDGEEVEVTDKAREMGVRVEELLGLDFEAFRRSVLLAQNQFAGFLEATGTDRNKVLKGVFGFDRLDAMRDAVKARLDGLGGRLQVLADRRETAESDRKQLEETRTALAAVDDRARVLESLRDSVNQVDEVLRSAEAKAEQATKEIAALDGLAEDIPDREASESLFAAAGEADERLAGAIAAVNDAEAAVVGATAGVDAAYEAAGGRQVLEDAADLVARHAAAVSRLESEDARLEEATAALAAARKAEQEASAGAMSAEAGAADAATRAEAAEVAERAARDALHDAHSADRAHALRTELEAGAPCPVCDQVVDVMPTARPAPEVEAARAAAESAIEAAAQARNELTEAQTRAARRRAAAAAEAERVAAAAAALEKAEQSQKAAATAVAELVADLAERLGTGDPAKRLAEHRATVSAAEERLVAARSVEAAARKGLEEIRAARDGARAGVERLRTSLSRLAGRLGADIDLGETADEVADGLKAIRSHWIGARDAAAKALEQATNEAEAARGARAEIMEGAGLAATDDIVEAAHQAAKEATALGATVEHLEKRLAEMEQLAGEERELVDQATLLERLRVDLLDTNFLRYVLDERRQDLADLAGVHLETLTAGRYRFSEDGEFNMVDLAAADAVRAPASLSGGETFLASLALALALAEIVSREGGRLDAFFLDEGFGSLDPEHLDLAMRGIERLVSAETDRLVVLVSHVPAMRDWMEDLIVLDRDPVTGTTRVVSGATR